MRSGAARSGATRSDKTTTWRTVNGSMENDPTSIEWEDQRAVPPGERERFPFLMYYFTNKKFDTTSAT
jgi:hypothetical protein